MPEAEVFHCVICAEPIPESRVIRKAVTCSEEHAIELKNARRRRRDAKVCHSCRRPTTPKEWAEFREWQAARGQAVKRGWKAGVKRGPKKKVEAEDPPAEQAPTPLESELGNITV